MADDRLRSLARRLRRRDDPETALREATIDGQHSGDPGAVEPPPPPAVDPQEAYVSENRRAWAKLVRDLRGPRFTGYE
jgi:hypothetical protein